MASIKTHAKQVQLVHLDFSDLAERTVTVVSFAYDAAARSGRLQLTSTESRETIRGEEQVLGPLTHKENMCSLSERRSLRHLLDETDAGRSRA